MEKQSEVKNNKKTSKKVKNYSLSQLEKIKKEEQVIDMYVEDIDESLNMIGIVGSNIKAIMPRDEASSIVGEDGLDAEKHIVNKKG